MPYFLFATACNKPRLRDPTQARGIIGRYWFDWDLAVGIEPDDCGEQRLIVHGEGWPGAWRIPAECNPDEFEPDFGCDGMPDFDRLLEELGPCLAEPLIVQAIGALEGHFPLLATEWSVPTGSNLVQRRDLFFEEQTSADQKPPSPQLSAR